jgi:HEPN domain-containing protein
MCHQAIEKILKAYFVSTKLENPPFTHNLTLLAKQSEIYGQMTEDKKDFIDCRRRLSYAGGETVQTETYS